MESRGGGAGQRLWLGASGTELRPQLPASGTRCGLGSSGREVEDYLPGPRVWQAGAEHPTPGILGGLTDAPVLGRKGTAPGWN